jgi:hypothetical protein
VTTVLVSVKGSERPIVLWGPSGRYRPGDEFVAFLQRNPSTRDFEPFACGNYMVPVKDGRVSWRPSGERDLDGVKVEDFLARVRALSNRARCGRVAWPNASRLTLSARVAHRLWFPF